MLELLKRGYSFLVPMGQNQRYDLVIDDRGDFTRVQCKTGRLRNGVILFPTCSTRSNRREVIRRGYDGEVDLFAGYCPQVGKVYLGPACGSPQQMALRVTATANGQEKGIRWASEHELDDELPHRD